MAADIIELSPSQRYARMLAFALSERGQADEKLVAELRSILVHRTPEADARRLAAIPGYDLTGRLPQITAPTLLVYGEDNPAASPEAGRGRSVAHRWFVLPASATCTTPPSTSRPTGPERVDATLMYMQH